MAKDVEDEWVRRVLQVEPALPGAGGGDVAAAAQGWRAASEAVDKQISSLQASLRGTDDEELHEIAEFGLNALTGGYKVRLLAALMGAEKGDARSISVLEEVVPGFRDHLDTDARVAACDANPFGVQVAIRSTLGPALDRLLKSLG